MQEVNSIHSVPYSSLRKQGLGIVCLLVAFSVFCFKWTPLPWFFSFAPLAGYIPVSYLGKKGFFFSLSIVISLGLSSILATQERSFLLLYTIIVFLAYLLTFLEKQRDQEEKLQYQNKVEAFDQEFTSVKKAYQAFQAQAVQERRALEQQLNQQFLHLEEKKERLARVEAQYKALQAQLYADTQLETPLEEPQQLEEYRQGYCQLEQQLQEQKDAQEKAEHQASVWEEKVHVLEIEKLDALCSPSPELLVLTKRITHLSLECERQEQMIQSLEELISLLLPFARTQLSK